MTLKYRVYIQFDICQDNRMGYRKTRCSC